MITIKITSWERDNHIDQGTSLSPEGNYSHIDMVRKRELLMERCSPDEMEAAAATAPATGGGSWPPSSLALVLQWRSLSPLDGCQGRGKFVIMGGSPRIRVFLFLYVSPWWPWPSDGWPLRSKGSWAPLDPSQDLSQPPWGTKVVAWPNPSNMVGVGLNHVTDSCNPVIRYLSSSKTGPQVAYELGLGCSWA